MQNSGCRMLNAQLKAPSGAFLFPMLIFSRIGAHAIMVSGELRRRCRMLRRSYLSVRPCKRVEGPRCLVLASSNEKVPRRGTSSRCVFVKQCWTRSDWVRHNLSPKIRFLPITIPNSSEAYIFLFLSNIFNYFTQNLRKYQNVCTENLRKYVILSKGRRKVVH